MKHVVMRYMSTRIKDLPYGCPGFGDIVHSALLTYNYGQHFNEEATLHIASHQYNRDKPITWKEVYELFPKNSIHLKWYKFSSETNQYQEFFDLLRKDNPDEYLKYAYDSMSQHCQAMLDFQKRGSIVFDYGNNLRGQAKDNGNIKNAFDYPGFVPAYIRPLFLSLIHI